MIKEQIHKIRTHLEGVANLVDAWFGEAEPLRAYRPRNGGWTIDEILEHIALTNHYLLILIDKGAKKAMKKLDSGNLPEALEHYTFQEEKLVEVGRHGSFEWIRPEHMEPTGNRGYAEVRETIRGQFERCQYHLQQMPNGEGILHKTRMTVNGLGKIDVYEYIHFLGKHTERHLEQMRKVKQEFLKNY